jgi:hypothetical protein
MQLVSGVAYRCDKLGLDETVNIFGVATVEIAGFRSRARLNLAQSFANFAAFGFGQHARVDQRLRVREARFDVGFDQSSIEGERGVEPRELIVRFAFESTAPEFHNLSFLQAQTKM